MKNKKIKEELKEAKKTGVLKTHLINGKKKHFFSTIGLGNQKNNFKNNKNG